MVSIAEPRPLTLEEQLRKWSALIWRCALRVGKRYHVDPEDVRGDLILALIRRHESYDPTWSYGTFVSLGEREVASRLALRQRRQVRAVQLEEVAVGGKRGDTITLADMATDYRTPDASDVATRREEAEAVRRAVAGLPSGHRSVLMANYFDAEDQSPFKNRQTRKKYLNRALSALADALAEGR